MQILELIFTCFTSNIQGLKTETQKTPNDTVYKNVLCKTQKNKRRKASIFV